MGGKSKAVGEIGDVPVIEATTLVDLPAPCEWERRAGKVVVALWDRGGQRKGACYDETRHFESPSREELDGALEVGVGHLHGHRDRSADELALGLTVGHLVRWR